MGASTEALIWTLKHKHRSDLAVGKYKRTVTMQLTIGLVH
jgi:hypothetical protein